MKRRDLEAHLRRHGCFRHHHGARHDIWVNAANSLQTSIPRHRELKLGLVGGVCKRLGVPRPSADG
jgi:hypothetical protein